jgi:hypothetical protein
MTLSDGFSKLQINENRSFKELYSNKGACEKVIIQENRKKIVGSGDLRQMSEYPIPPWRAL